MKNLEESTIIASVIALIFGFIGSFILTSCTNVYAQRGYDSATEERFEKKARDNEYWDRQNKKYDSIRLQDYESEAKYRKERRKLDLNERKNNSSSKRNSSGNNRRTK